jgi:phage gp29-like protein
MGSAGVFVHPEGTKINFIESKSQSGSSDLYEKLITTCNNEVSKLVLGNTLTTEVGSSGGNRSLGETMKESEIDIINADKKMLLNVLNSQLIPLFQKFGIAIDGEFSFVESINLKDRIDLDIKINSACPIEPSYFEETYGVPILKTQKNNDPKKLFFTKSEKSFLEKLYSLFS